MKETRMERKENGLKKTKSEYYQVVTEFYQVIKRSTFIRIEPRNVFLFNFIVYNPTAACI